MPVELGFILVHLLAKLTLSYYGILIVLSPCSLQSVIELALRLIPMTSGFGPSLWPQHSLCRTIRYYHDELGSEDFVRRRASPSWVHRRHSMVSAPPWEMSEAKVPALLQGLAIYKTSVGPVLGSPKPILSFCRLLQVSIQP